MENSWIKLHRKFLESPLWRYSVEAKMPHLISLWCYLLLSVNWEEKKWYDGKEEVIIPSGSLITSISHLAQTISLTNHQVRVAFDHYEKMKMMTRKTTNKWTQVWIVNWAKYQMRDNSNNKVNDKRMTNESQTDGKPMATTKEYKNIRNKEDINSDTNVSAQPSLLILTRNQKETLRKKYPYVSLDRAILKFRTWQEANGVDLPNMYKRFELWLQEDEEKQNKITNAITEDPMFPRLVEVYHERVGAKWELKSRLLDSLNNKFPLPKYENEWNEARAKLRSLPEKEKTFMEMLSN